MRSIILSLLLVSLLGSQELPQRVVSQTVGTDELLIDLCEPHRIAALSFLSKNPSYSDVVIAAQRFPQIQDGSAEQILKYKPDLVLFSNYSRPELVEQIKRAGIPILVFDRFNTLEDVYRNIRILGTALGRTEAAESLIRQCEDRVTALRSRLQGVVPRRVLAPSSYHYLAGSQTTFQDLCDHAGAINVAGEAGLRGHSPTPTETLMRWKVDYLVISDIEVPEKLATLRKHPSFGALSATQAGRVILLPEVLLSSVSHRRIRGYEMMAQQLHPESFR
ncbi:MAG: ABC transporter substrate-binding protein [Holophagaceae bacterium]